MNENKEAPFVMTIEIDEGKIEKLKIFFDSKPDEVAYEFCRENNLDFNALKFLTQEIKCVLANGLQEKNKMSLMEDGIKEVNESQELVSDERKINRNPLSNNANNIDKMPNNLNPIKSLNKSESKKKMNSVFFLTSENDVKNTNFENNKLDNAFNNNNKQNISLEKFNYKDDLKKRNIRNENNTKNLKVEENYSNLYKKGKAKNNLNDNNRLKTNSDNLAKNNDFNQSIFSLKNKLSSSYSRQFFISSYNLHKEEVRMKLRQKHKKKESFSFSPVINKKSEEMIYSRNNSSGLNHIIKTNKHNQLYEYYKFKQQKLKNSTEEFYKGYTFSPKINAYNFEMNFNERQEVYKQIKMKKQKEIKNQEENPIDTKTQQRLFTPQILSNNYSEDRNTEKLNNHLLSYSGLFSLRKSQQSLNIQEEFKQKSNMIHTQKNSEDILNLKKYRAFQSLFEAMDKDEDKVITFQTISFNIISNELRKILNPLVIKLKEEQCTMNQKDFINYCEFLYESLTIEKKQIILEFEKNYHSKNVEFNSKNNSLQSNRIKKNLSNKSLNFDGIINYRMKNKSFYNY